MGTSVEIEISALMNCRPQKVRSVLCRTEEAEFLLDDREIDVSKIAQHEGLKLKQVSSILAYATLTGDIKSDIQLRYKPSGELVDKDVDKMSLSEIHEAYHNNEFGEKDPYTEDPFVSGHMAKNIDFEVRYFSKE